VIRLLWVAVVVSAASAALSSEAPGRGAALVAPPRVGCDQVIDRNAVPPAGYRVLVGVVAAPRPHIQAVLSGNAQWPYWSKAGVGIRAGRASVVISVPRAWRSRVAITWGNAPIGSSLTIAGCPSPPHVWNGYAGGFYLRSEAECVPLAFRVGRRTAVVRFGVGRRCP
jgi:hypothetical protein